MDEKSKKEIMQNIAVGIGGMYFAIYHIWMEDHSYVCYREQLNGILNDIGEKGDYLPAWKTYIEKYVVEEDQRALGQFADFYTLADRLKNKKSISHVYRRKGVGWTRGEFIAVTRDDEQNVQTVLFAVTDINEEMKNRIQKERAEQEALHDPLTGLLNRKAFDVFKESEKYTKFPLGIMIVDVDRFKDINDQLGHLEGDRVLKKVGNMLVEVMRQSDCVFRMGGDEFVVFIYNCKEDIWHHICKRLHNIHQELAEGLAENVVLTLSVGFCIAPGGYSQEAFLKADEALYHTKGNGRGGCTLISPTGYILRQWKDDQFQSQGNQILIRNSTGTWKADIPKKPGLPIRMYFDDTMKRMMEIEEELSPEESYWFWKKRIDPRFEESIQDALQAVLRKKQAEVTYQWKHPQFGPISIRCGSSYDVEKEDYHCIFGYYHEMKQTEIYTPQDISEEIQNALEEIYYCNFYIDLETFTFIPYKIQDYMIKLLDGVTDAQEAVRLYIDQVVADLSKEPLQEFLDLRTLGERMRMVNLLEMDYADNVLGWCKMRLVAVKRDEDARMKKVSLIVEAKNQMSMESALRETNQLCYEYDPIQHTGICYTDTNFLQLPRRIENFPEALRELKLLHPEDVEPFIETIHRMDQELPKAQSDMRIFENGKYNWYSCLLNRYYAPEKERYVVMMTLVEISGRAEMIQGYERRLDFLLGMNEKSLTIGHFNLTQNTYKNVRHEDEMIPYIDETKSLEEIMDKAADAVVGEETQKAYRQLFSRENMFHLAEQGQMHVEMEHLFRMSENHIEWLVSVFDMLKNPVTGEIVGVCHSKSVQEMRMASLHLQKTLEQDYPMAAVVIAETGEFYLFDTEKGTYGTVKTGFWEILDIALKPIIINVTQEEIQSQVSKAHILNALKEKKEFVWAFDSDVFGGVSRLEYKFSYLDQQQNLLLASIRNITDTILLKKLQHDNEHDPLTDLYNRRTIFKKSKQLLLEHPDDQFVMVHIDMKHFHLYNTFFGDEVGDQLLCDVADQFRLLDADYDYWVYGRIEADVFCAFFPYDAAKFRKHVEHALDVVKNYRDDFLIEPVLGVYFVTDRNMPIELMFTRATIAAKAVQPETPNATMIYNESMEQKMAVEQQIVNEMQTAIMEEQFEVYVQPKYSLATDRAVGAEALVRWAHPEKGLISPAYFIPVFEKNGFIAKLDRYMWEHVCRYLNKWQAEGRKLEPISVNVSRISMFSPNTVQFLKDLVKKYELEPRYLELELTESAYIDDPEEMKKQMYDLRAAGFKILMDDFGSGYSSLNTLRELPVDCLKLDMKFLSNECEDERGQVVLSSIVDMSRQLKLPVIAEGVEKKEQAEFLRGIGCDYVQGFLFARPMPVEEYEKVLLSYDIPVARALVEYMNGSLVHLRVSPLFFKEFEMEEDLRRATEVFKSHLNEENQRRFIKAFDKCAQTMESVVFRFFWDESEEKQREYVGRISYQGMVGNSVAMTVEYTNITERDL